LAKLEKGHFDIWLGLFKTTVDELFEGEKTEQIKNRAASIATAIQLNTVYQKK
jgi:hemoglobin